MTQKNECCKRCARVRADLGSAYTYCEDPIACSCHTQSKSEGKYWYKDPETGERVDVASKSVEGDWAARFEKVFGHITVRDAGKHWLSVYTRIESFIETELAKARESEREAAAKIVDGWHISKGGYGELAHVIRNQPTHD